MRSLRLAHRSRLRSAGPTRLGAQRFTMLAVWCQDEERFASLSPMRLVLRIIRQKPVKMLGNGLKNETDE